jgi:hypothetical protein
MQKTVDLCIGGDHFHTERNSITGEMKYFLNDLAVTVTVYLARMQHYREIELQRLFGRPHCFPARSGGEDYRERTPLG